MKENNGRICFNLLTKKKMHIKSQREIFRQVVKPYCDDVFDFFQLARGGEENFLHKIEMEFIDKQEEELTKYMNSKGTFRTRDDLRNEYIFWVEKNRGRPLDMGEMWDIEEAIENWAKDNGYGYLYED